eukprot:Blabericola_migrator_1__12904@NODE_846_length_6285_cov_66_757961_g598_i0_p3_GENE_NODE_846_length_6285_cov_66_757961_g598_i0NODE_846_length_6285_cov_66_757961_g598_i0_p3_ORF_typecomplete_len256_score70_384HB_MCP_1/PF12729_7/6_54HB_MCP_1/PF12729_7/6_8e024HB_MCP_1/PF12729_7/0_07Gag_p30/PF02093_16/22Gag_p30/PF02093_16/0_28DUF2866/PF11065_8/0_014Phasin/PF05597_11/0_013Phasin/PF05597_11/1_5e02TMPIT/PF07851_13/0_058TMPIT/PF07851_13/55Laminin_II/PF06009_12/3_1Laminin_II/PF06009_12/2_2CCDC158/PF15921_5/8
MRVLLSTFALLITAATSQAHWADLAARSLFKSQKETVFDELTKGAKEVVKQNDKTAKKLKKAVSEWLPDYSTAAFDRSKADEAMRKVQESKKKALKIAEKLPDDTKRHLKIALDDMETAVLNDIVTSLLLENQGAWFAEADHPRKWAGSKHFSSSDNIFNWQSPPGTKEPNWHHIRFSLRDLFSSQSTEEEIRNQIMKQFSGRRHTLNRLKGKIDQLAPSADKNKLLKDFRSLEKSFEQSVKSLSGMLMSYADDL